MKSQLIIIALICLISINSIVALEEARRTHKRKARKWAVHEKCICSSQECGSNLYEGELPDKIDNVSDCACSTKKLCKCDSDDTKKHENKFNDGFLVKLDDKKPVMKDGKPVLTKDKCFCLKTCMKTTLQNLAEAAAKAGKALSNQVKSTISSVNGAVQNAVNKTEHVASAALSGFANGANGVLQGAVNTVSGAVNTVSGAVNNATDAIDPCICKNANFSTLKKNTLVHVIQQQTLLKNATCDCKEQCVCPGLKLLKKRFAKLRKQHKVKRARKLLKSLNDKDYEGHYLNGDNCTCPKTILNKLVSGVKDLGRNVNETAHDLAVKAQNTTHNVVQSVNDSVHYLAEKAKNTAHDLAEKAKDTTHNVVQSINDTAHDLAEKAKKTAHDLAEKAKDTTHNVVKSINDTAHDLAEKAKDTAHSLKDKAVELVDSCDCKNANFTSIAINTIKPEDHHANSIMTISKTVCQCQEHCYCPEVHGKMRRFAKLRKQHKFKKARKLFKKIVEDNKVFNGTFQNGDFCTCDKNVINQLKQAGKLAHQSANALGSAIVTGTHKLYNSMSNKVKEFFSNAKLMAAAASEWTNDQKKEAKKRLFYAIGQYGEYLAGDCEVKDTDYQVNPQDKEGPFVAYGYKSNSETFCRSQENCNCETKKYSISGRKCECKDKKRFSRSKFAKLQAYCSQQNQSQCLALQGCKFSKSQQQCNANKQLRLNKSKKIKMNRNINRFRQVLLNRK